MLLALALGSTAAARLAGVGTVGIEAAPVTLSRDLLFLDQEGGLIAVRDAHRQQHVAVLEPGSSGFVRVVVRGLARERLSAGIGPDVPFRLMRHSDGRLSLQDLATGRIVTLNAFGSANAAAFAPLIE
jgi:putative photosynthetic complex assembly protein